MRFAALLLSAVALLAQSDTPRPLLSTSDADQLFRRMLQLMESTGASIPELQLATAPLVAGAKNTFAVLQQSPRNGPQTAEFLRRTRAFLAIADVTPKPFPFPDVAEKQFTELRDDQVRLEAHFAALIAEKERLARNPDPSNLKRYSDANSRVLPPGTAPRVVFLGDSITDAWHLNEYFTGRDFINRGISGQVTTEMLGRMQPDVINLRPTALMILGGTNDIARGTALDVIENNLMMMSDLAHLHGIKVLIASVLPVSDYHKNENPGFEMSRDHPPQAISQLNGWIQNFCAKSGDIYVDYFSKLRDPSGMMQAELADDGLHPNAKGYRIMAPIAEQGISRALGVSVAPKEPPKRRRGRLL